MVPLVDWTLSDKASGSSLSLQNLPGMVSQQASVPFTAAIIITVIFAALCGCCLAPQQAFHAFVWLATHTLMPLPKLTATARLLALTLFDTRAGVLNC